MNINLSGLWKSNPAFVQLLGMCPLLATSSTVINGISMGIATTLVLSLSGFIISATRDYIPKSVRLPIFMLVIAGSVTLLEVLMKAFFFDLYLSLGIFIPLIVTNCIIVGRAEAFASRNPIALSLADGLVMGIGFTWVLALLGSVREILAKGTLFSGADMLLGSHFANKSLYIAQPQMLLLAALPAGAFIVFGLLLAAKNYIDNKIVSANLNKKITENYIENKAYSD